MPLLSPVGMIGANHIARAAPDGYQVLFGGGGSLTYNQIIYAKPNFNSLTDFTPVVLLTRQPLVLIARKSTPAGDLREFIRFVKENKAANFGSAGVGSSTHLGCVMLNLAMGVEAAHVPYRGVALAMQDLIGGRIDYICNQIQDALPQIQAGNVRAIAILSSARSPLLPDVPTAADQGLSGLDIFDWYGLFLPKGASPLIVQKLHDTAVAALETPPFRRRLGGLGVHVVPAEQRSPDFLGRFLQDEIARWTAPIKGSGIPAQ